MRIKMDVWIDVDKLTSERFLNATPQHRFKMLWQIGNTRPDAVSFSEPVTAEEGTTDEAPPAKPS